MTDDAEILIVDDSAFDRHLLADVLNKKGFRTQSAEGGEECLLSVARRQPDLIVLDIMMPDVHGNQVLRSLRQAHNPVELPVIMITAKADPASIVESLHFGANDYITKPVNFEIAVMRILTHLKLAQLSREMARLSEIEAVNAMIVTYNHEINNPLAIALGALQSLTQQSDAAALDKLESSLWRVADIVKRITRLTQSPTLATEAYVGGKIKMLKVT